MQDIIRWLESPEGERWSASVHQVPIRGNMLVTVVDDLADWDHAFIWYA